MLYTQPDGEKQILPLKVGLQTRHNKIKQFNQKLAILITPDGLN